MQDYSIESTERNFTKKFLIVRSFYGLTIRDLAALLNYKSSANITHFEKAPILKKPSFQTIIGIQQLYGISVDWLFGLSRTPYTEESVKQAEIEQQNRFFLDYDDIAKNPQTPEATISFLKMNLFPNYVIWQKLQLSDRFVLILLLNYLALYIFKYYRESHTGNVAKKVYDMKEVLGLVPSVEPEEIKKHADFLPAFLKLKEAVELPFEYQYPHNPSQAWPSADSMKRIEHSVLDKRWDFLEYLKEQGLDVK